MFDQIYDIYRNVDSVMPLRLRIQRKGRNKMESEEIAQAFILRDSADVWRRFFAATEAQTLS